MISGTMLLIDKPKGQTSFQAIHTLRKAVTQCSGKKLKVGHAGTLDPLASGLLIVCTGTSTKSISSYLNMDKEYIAKIRLGATRHSHDMETPIDKYYPTEHIHCKTLEKTLTSFTGKIEQCPPVYSAIKIDGERAYNKARRGEPVKMKKREVFISELALLEFHKDWFSCRIRCSKGTYIRSLAFDIGVRMNTGAYLEELRRTAIGPYRVENAFSLDALVEQLPHKRIIVAK